MNKRKTKNIIISIILLITIGLVLFTMYDCKNNLKQTTMMQENNQTPPSMPGNSDGNTIEPPSMPTDSNNTENNKTNMNEPPEKPEGNNQNQLYINNENTKLTNKYYLIFASESLVISIIIIYLIMSKFNKKNLKETIKTSDKFIILLLFSIILTGCLTYLNSKIATNYFLNNENNNNDEINNNSTTSITYSASKEIKEDLTITSGSYSSNKTDNNAILVSGSINASLSNLKINKTGDSDGGDNTSFYGINSAIIAKSGANLILKNITVETNATGANGVFSYGGSATTNNSSSDGTTVTISDSTITTTKDNSGGIMTTGGGVMKSSNLTINTSGISSAAIRTDRGGGDVTVDGGTYTTTGKGSPTIYSTANIKVNNAKLIAKASEGIVIEGKNKVTINNCDLTDNNKELNGQSTTYKNIFLYQSMSGDASSGTSEFSSTDSTITTNKGDSFYITNTTATINLENNTIINNDNDGNFLRAQKDSWGTNGSNGGAVTLTLTNQEVSGNIVIDSISTLDMTMKTNSYYEGMINNDKSAKSIKLTLDKSSKIKLTGNSYVTSLEDEDTTYSNIDFNGYKLYVNGTSIN